MRAYKPLILLAVACPVLAQRDTTPVPRALFTAMILHYADRYGENADPNIQVGSLPPELAGKIGVPPRGRILGAINLRTSTVVFGEVPGSAPALLQWINDDFRARGYSPGPRWENVGFVTPKVGVTTEWCDGRRGMSIRTRNDRATMRTALFEISVTDEGSGCDAGARSTDEANDPSMIERKKLPLLVNPPGSQPGLLCNEEPGLNNMSFSNTAEVGYRSALTPAQIMAHYARQLDSAGWKREAPPPAAWGLWTRTDSTGVTRNAALLITPLLGVEGCRQARLHIYKRDK
jgi:hypothetical protein